MPGGEQARTAPAGAVLGGWAGAARLALHRLNRLALGLSMGALVLACVVLAAGAMGRYFFKVSTEWQDEFAVFLLVFVTFGASGWVQSERGHVAIDVLAACLPPRLESLRRRLCDGVALLFCGFFAWKSWSLAIDAWREGVTSESTWAPPLWIPYAIMAAGMSLFTLQLAFQVLGVDRPAAAADLRR